MRRRYKLGQPRYPDAHSVDMLVAVDLGKTKVGVAVFNGRLVRYNNQLEAAFTVNAPRGSTPAEVAGLVVSETAKHVMPWWSTAWVCEWPMKYDHKRKQHKDLDSLHEVGYALAQLNGGWVETYLPGEWKGNVPKPAHHRRIERALKPHELELMPSKTDHDAWDAAGIGLFATARTKRGGTL
jgi:hypothetical protein